MRDIEWWEIGTRALRNPFVQWPTLLACCVPSAVLGILSYFLLKNAHTHGLLAEDLSVTVGWGLAVLLFEWFWMTALWHDSFRHLATFASRLGFWVYVAVFGSFNALAIIWLAAPESVSDYLDIDRKLGLAVWIVCLIFLLWIWLRLSIWPAAVIAKGTWVDPRSIWRATRGLAWDMFLIQVVIGVPSVLIGFGLMATEHYLPVTPALQEALLFTGLTIELYFAAATCSALLLAYHDVIVAPFHRIKRPN